MATFEGTQNCEKNLQELLYHSAACQFKDFSSVMMEC
jgi:hypothetical protein